MAVTVNIPSVLRSSCGGEAELTLPAHTVREALQQIEKTYPQLYRSVCNETGAVRQHVNLFIDSSLVRGAPDLDRTLSEGEVITIFQAVSGG